MSRLTHQQYDALERAVRDAARIAVVRQGREMVVVPQRLDTRGGRETIEAVHPTTGQPITLYLDDLDSLEAVR